MHWFSKGACTWEPLKKSVPRRPGEPLLASSQPPRCLKIQRRPDVRCNRSRRLVDRKGDRTLQPMRAGDEHFKPAPDGIGCNPCLVRAWDVGAGGLHTRFDAAAACRRDSLRIKNGDRHETILPGTLLTTEASARNLNTTDRCIRAGAERQRHGIIRRSKQLWLGRLRWNRRPQYHRPRQLHPSPTRAPRNCWRSC
jgi:hypothetical protein